MSDTGVTWGEPKFEKSKFELLDKASKALVEVPASSLTDVTPTKIDLVLELKGTPTDGQVYSSEVRFHVRPDKEDDEPMIARMTKSFRKMVSGGDEDLGECIVKFENLTFLGPNGVYTLEVFAKHSVLTGRARGQGMSQKWVIAHSDLNGLSLLPEPGDDDSAGRWMVMTLKKPVKHGNQSLWHLTVSLPDELLGDGSGMKMNLEPLSEQQRGRQDKEGKPLLREEMQGVLGDLVPRVLKSVSGCSAINAPPNTVPIACSNKTGKAGYIYLMRKLLLFAPSPAQPVRFEDIQRVTFEGLAEGYTTIMLTFHFKKSAQKLTYQGISPSEGPALVECFRDRSILVEGHEAKKLTALGSDDEFSEGSLADQQGGYEGLEAESDEGKSKKRKRADDGKSDKRARK